MSSFKTDDLDYETCVQISSKQLSVMSQVLNPDAFVSIAKFYCEPSGHSSEYYRYKHYEMVGDFLTGICSVGAALHHTGMQ